MNVKKINDTWSHLRDILMQRPNVTKKEIQEILAIDQALVTLGAIKLSININKDNLDAQTMLKQITEILNE